MVRDSYGIVIATYVVFKPLNLDVDIAEAWALVHGLVWVVDEGFSKIEVECDSLGVVTALNLGDQILLELGTINVFIFSA